MSVRRAVPIHPHRRPIATAASLTLRLRVYLTRGRLDRKIAGGGPYPPTAALALRARQLAKPRTRRQIARSLREIVSYADRRASRRGFSAVVVEPVAVRRARHPILGLAERLEGPAHVNPAGVARAQVLITDGASPLFNRNSPLTVTQALYEVQDALESDASHVLHDAAR